MNELILLVENGPEEEPLVRRIVDRYGSHKVKVAHDGAEALDVVFGTETHPGVGMRVSPHLVLLGLTPREADHRKVLQRMRSDPRAKLIPVVIFSSSTSEKDKLECYALGANSYIRKPADFQKLCDTLEQVCSYWMGINQLPLL